MKHIYILIYSLALFMLYSCSEKEVEPISGSLGKPEKPVVSNIKEIAGGAILTYALPKSKDVLAVKCIYTLSNGRKHERLSSFYENTIKIEGFVDTEVHEVALYTVNRGQELSDPTTVSFTPLEAPLSKVIKTVEMTADFGGVRYRWQNADNAYLNLEFITPDSTGVMQAARIYTSSSNVGVYTIRGYASEARTFAAVIRDNFGNASDTIFPLDPVTNERIQITPIFEKKLDKGPIIIWKLANDVAWNAHGTSELSLLDDNIETFAHSPQNSLPSPVTLDLGRKCKLSRVVIHQRRYNGYYYSWGNPRNFNVYGSVNKPSSSGNWNEWPLLEKFEIIKPSGLPLNQASDEDVSVAQEGHSFSFDLDQPPLRYVRFLFNDTWAALTTVHVCEITFHGNDEVE